MCIRLGKSESFVLMQMPMTMIVHVCACDKEDQGLEVNFHFDKIIDTSDSTK